MREVHIPFGSLRTTSDLTRSSRNRTFEERLRASIEQIGLIEPLKVARVDVDDFVIIDGVMRWGAIQAIRSADPTRFDQVAVYVLDHDRRFEIRFQTDIYQDLLPSQLAQLVEHLHTHDRVAKHDIAQYLGISAATLRNYTGLWRLVQRGGRFKAIVELMDAGIVPSSNPYAWLRLSDKGLDHVLGSLARGAHADDWIARQLDAASRGRFTHLSLKEVEEITGALPSEMYREGEEVRARKKALGQRRASGISREVAQSAQSRLVAVQRETDDAVLCMAAASLAEYLA